MKKREMHCEKLEIAFGSFPSHTHVLLLLLLLPSSSSNTAGLIKTKVYHINPDGGTFRGLMGKNLLDRYKRSLLSKMSKYKNVYMDGRL